MGANREKIIGNLSLLVDKTGHIDNLLKQTLDNRILSRDECIVIKSEKHIFKKTFNLYAIVIKKDEDTIERFFECLKGTQNELVLDALSKECILEPGIWFDTAKPAIHFVGRDAELERMWSYQQTCFEERKLCLIAITGIEGAGKSDLAKSFAKRFHEKGHVIWINASSTQSIGNSFNRLSKKIGFSKMDKSSDDHITRGVYKAMSVKERNCLYIFDNVQNYQVGVLSIFFNVWDYMPPRKTIPSVILTSRESVIDNFERYQVEQIKLDMLTNKHATDFIIKSLGLQNIDNVTITTISQLCEKLGNRPQALQQVRATIVSTLPNSPLRLIITDYHKSIDKTKTNSTTTIPKNIASLNFRKSYKEFLSQDYHRKIPEICKKSNESVIFNAHHQHLQEYYSNDLEQVKISSIQSRVQEIWEHLHNVLQALRAYEKYHEEMSQNFKMKTCLSDQVFDTLHEKYELPRLLPNRSLKKDLIKYFGQDILCHAKCLYIADNKAVKEMELQSIWQTLEKLYNDCMSNNLSGNIYRSQDIIALHDHYVQICNVAASTCFSKEVTGIDISKFQHKYGKLLTFFLQSNDENIDWCTEVLAKLTSFAATDFSENFLRISVEEVMGDTALEILLEKLKNQSSQKLRQKIQEILPKENNSRFHDHFERKIDQMSIRWKEQNRERIDEEEQKGCEGPVLILLFGRERVRVGYTDNGRLHLAMFGSENHIKNSITFLKSGGYDIGKSLSSDETQHELAISEFLRNEHLLHNNCDKIIKVVVNNQQIDVPINFQFISTLFVHRIFEYMERVGNFRTSVITVPLWMPSRYRQSIKDAAIIAGCKKVFLLNDTTAAVLASDVHFSNSYFEIPIFQSGSSSNCNNTKKAILVVVPDGVNSTAAVYQNRFNTFQSELHMVHNANFGATIGGEAPCHADVLSNIVDTHSIDRIVIVSHDSTKRKECRDEIEDKIQRVTHFTLSDDDLLLVGTQKYAKALCNSLGAAKAMVKDLTYYNLRIHDPKLHNQTIMRRMAPLDQHVEAVYELTEENNEFSIYETYDNEQLYMVDCLRISTTEVEKLKIFSFVNTNGIYEVHTIKGSFDIKDKKEEEFKFQRDLLLKLKKQR